MGLEWSGAPLGHQRCGGLSTAKREKGAGKAAKIHIQPSLEEVGGGTSGRAWLIGRHRTARLMD